jgi:polyhydroxybutyrate depolymerase
MGVSLIAYRCPDHATVEVYREEGDGHTWPGSQLMVLPSVWSSLGPTTFAIDADQLMWAFFQSHPLLDR